MAVPKHFLEEVKSRLRLSDIIGRRTKITRAGREFKACCPFHKEKTPSFTINDEKGFYHCFGCGAHGDHFSFLTEHDNIGFMEAVEQLAGEAGMDVPRPTPEETERYSKRDHYYALMNAAMTWFEGQLHSSRYQKIQSYLSGRAIADDTIAEFHIGYAPDDRDALLKHLRDKGFNDHDMIEMGLAKRSEHGVYAFFRGRVIFPVADARGRIVAFGGRALPDEFAERLPSPDFTPPKYLNSPDTPLFHKGTLLYGQSRARMAAAKGQPLIVVEGYMDVIACAAAGFKGAVAPMGTALTEEQIAALWRMGLSNPEEKNRDPILCFDGDNAGIRAASRAAERILPSLEPGASVRYAFMPDSEDPDSLIKTGGAKAFQAILEAAIPMINMVWKDATEGKFPATTPEAQAGIKKTLLETASRITDREVQGFYRRALLDLLYNTLKEQNFHDRKKNFSRNKKGPQSPLKPVHKPLHKDTSVPEKILIATMINHPVLFETFEERLGVLHIANQRLDSLRQAVLFALSDNPECDSDCLKGILVEKGYAQELETLLTGATYIHAGFARPDVETEEAKKGWQQTLDFLGRTQFEAELEDAGKILSRDFTRENESRIRSLKLHAKTTYRAEEE